MITSVKNDLSDLVDVMEHLAKKLPTLTIAEQVDVAARVNAMLKSGEKICNTVKDIVKQRRNGKEGYVVGETFKAYLKLVDTHRLDQKALSVEEPEIFDRYNKPATDQRVTFEAR